MQEGVEAIGEAFMEEEKKMDLESDMDLKMPGVKLSH